MPINFSPNVSSNTRVHVSQSAPQDGGEPVFTLSKPSGLARFGRGALNVVSHLFCYIPGVKYTKNFYNPGQWQAFRNAILTTHARDISEGRLTEANIDTILSAYSHHKRLTQGKASAVLDAVQHAAKGESIVPRDPGRLNASQFAPGRGLRTLGVMIKGLNTEARALRDRFADSNDDKAVAIRNILRPGRTITNTSVAAGQEALQKYADQTGANFSFSSRGMDSVSLGVRLDEVIRERRDAIGQLRKAAVDQPDKPALLSIPVILEPKTLGFHERHVVELAVDFRHNKLLYLDSKGESIEAATRNYDSGDVAQALGRFGKNIFGAGWSAETGIVQMTQAKQQGANDCGAFTHDFTRRLIDGQSVGDIERSFNADDRRMLRINMAKDIAGPDGPASAPEEVPPPESGLISQKEDGHKSDDLVDLASEDFQPKPSPHASVALSEDEKWDNFFEQSRKT